MLLYMLCFIQANKIKYNTTLVTKVLTPLGVHQLKNPGKFQRLHRYQFNKNRHLESVKVTLKSHNFFANSSSLAKALGFARLLSEKYSPLTPLTCGCNAT